MQLLPLKHMQAHTYSHQNHNSLCSKWPAGIVYDVLINTVQTMTSQ